MSLRTKHYTVRQRQALLHTARIKRAQRNVDRHWWQVAENCWIVRERHLFTELDCASFDEWCEREVEMSPSHGNFLAQWYGLPGAVKKSLQGLGIAKSKLLMPHLNLSNGSNEAEMLKFILAHAHMRWHDLRQELRGDDIQPKPVEWRCACGRRYWLSRAVEVQLR